MLLVRAGGEPPGAGIVPGGNDRMGRQDRWRVRCDIDGGTIRELK
jgi:hypothetical protein